MNVMAGAFRSRCRHDDHRRAAVCAFVAARCEAARHGAHPSGAVALRSPDGRREHPDGPRAGARSGWLDRSAMAREAGAVLEAFHHPELHADRLRPRAADRGAAGRRDLPRDGRARVHRADGRADQQPAARGRRAAVRAHPAAARSRRGDRLHQSFPRGSSRDCRSLHRAARRAERGVRRDCATSPTTRSSRTWSAGRWTRSFRSVRRRRPTRCCSTSKSSSRRLRSSGPRFAAPRGDPRHRRAHRLGPHRDGARADGPRAGCGRSGPPGRPGGAPREPAGFTHPHRAPAI